MMEDSSSDSSSESNMFEQPRVLPQVIGGGNNHNFVDNHNDDEKGFDLEARNINKNNHSPEVSMESSWSSKSKRGDPPPPPPHHDEDMQMKMDINNNNQSMRPHLNQNNLKVKIPKQPYLKFNNLPCSPSTADESDQEHESKWHMPKYNDNTNNKSALPDFDLNIDDSISYQKSMDTTPPPYASNVAYDGASEHQQFQPGIVV